MTSLKSPTIKYNKPTKLTYDKIFGVWKMDDMIGKNIVYKGMENGLYLTGWDGATLNVSYNQPDPFGGNTAVRLQTTGGNSSTKIVDGSTYRSAISSNVSLGIWVKDNGSTVGTPQFSYSASGTINIPTTWTYKKIENFAITPQNMFQFAITGTGATLDISFCQPMINLGRYLLPYSEPYGTVPQIQSVKNYVPSNVVANNIIKNSNFVDGLSGWETVSSTQAITDGVLVNTGAGASSPYSRSNSSYSVVSSHKIYYRVKAKVTNSSCLKLNLIIAGTDTGNNVLDNYASVSNPINDLWYSISGLNTTAGSRTGYYRAVLQHTYVDASTAEGKQASFKEILVIDVTDLFGAGNEPSKGQCDELFKDWFEGSKNFSISGYNGMLGATDAFASDDPQPNQYGINLDGADYVSFLNNNGNINQPFYGCQFALYRASNMSKSAGIRIFQVNASDYVATGSITSAFSDEILGIFGTTYNAWCGDEIIPAGWNILSIWWENGRYNFTLNNQIRKSSSYGTPSLLTSNNFSIGKAGGVFSSSGTQLGYFIFYNKPVDFGILSNDYFVIKRDLQNRLVALN